MICEVCVVEGQQGDGILQGDFPLCTATMLPTCLPTAALSSLFSQFYAHTLGHVF